MLLWSSSPFWVKVLKARAGKTMFMSIKCQSCGKETQMSLLEPNFEGPFKCWKCQGFAQIKIVNGEVAAWQTLTADEAKRVQEREATRRKAAGG